jgi:DNA-binding transcriptional MerR regulator
MSSKPQQPLNKLFYRIGEVSRLTGLEAYVLRYWETEYPQLKPQKGKSGQRLYKKEDVEHVLRIKQMLYSEGYTIAGARKKLSSKAGQDPANIIESAQKELRDILEILK